MKNIFKIYKRDIITIKKNWAALIMIIVLIVVPSLYSLINIKASWDPYGSTSGIKIAVVNEDQGATFKDQNINVGEELIEKLKDNTKMGWQFVDAETAERGVLDEKYYAEIVIPEDFSEDTVTLTTKNVTKPKLKYTVNEKKNVIAPKMTDAGVNTIKTETDENIVKTVSGVMFKIFNELGIDIEKNRGDIDNIRDAVYELDENIPELETILNSALDGTTETKDLLVKVNEMIPTVSNTIDTTDDFLQNGKEVLNSTQGELSDISPIIKQDLVMAENTFDSLSVQMANIDDKIAPEVAEKMLKSVSDGAEAVNVTIDDIEDKLKSINKFLDKVSNIEIKDFDNDETGDSKLKGKLSSQIDSLKDIQNNLKDIRDTIKSILSKLDTIKDKTELLKNKSDDELNKLKNGKHLDLQTIKDLKDLIDQIHTLISDTTDSYDSQIASPVEKIINLIRQVSEDGLTVVQEGRDILPNLEKLLSQVTDSVDSSNGKLADFKDELPDIKDKIHNLADKFKEMNEDNKVDEILDMVTNNWDEQSLFLSSPVKIEDNRLFPWPNYGSTATPFYTVLCLWVGGLLASALLSLNVPEFDDKVIIKPYEIYLGKLLLFLSLGIFQALAASLGALFILKSYSVHPIMFIGFSVLTSLIFVTIIYTAASVLDDIGKAIIVVILVLQMAGTSGNFPIEVTPKFFQQLYPYLPFTYAINGMRQIMAGIVYPILIKDILILCAYFIVAFIFGILFKGIIGKMNKKIMDKLNASGILRH